MSDEGDEEEEAPPSPFDFTVPDEAQAEEDREERFQTTCKVHGNEPATATRTWSGGKVVNTVWDPCPKCLAEKAASKKAKAEGEKPPQTPGPARLGGKKAGGTPEIGTPVTGKCPQCGKNKVEGVIGAAGRGIFPRCADCQQTEAAGQASARAEEEAARTSERKRVAASNIREYVRRIGVDDDAMEDCSFGNFYAYYDRDALVAGQEFVADMERGKRPGLFLYSKRPDEAVAPGNGKTHLAIACARHAMTMGILGPDDILFVRESRLTMTFRRLLMKEGAGEGPEAYLDRLIRIPLLIIDDVGKAKLDGSWIREIMFELAAGRGSRSTIRTSNFSPDELIARDEELWAPIVSRIFGAGQVAELTGPDQRPNILREGKAK